MEVCSENWGLTALASPRISFSHDLSQSDLSPSSTPTETPRLDSSLPLDSTADDFDFSLSIGLPTHDPSLADELFSNGKLLPLPIKNPSAPLPPYSPTPPPLPPPAVPYPKKHGSLREIMASSDDDDDNVIKRSPSSSQRSFWRFRRSNSLNCGGGSRTGLICPFTLLRSKSTGSSPTINPPTVRSRPDKHHNKTNQNNGTRGSCSKDDSSINPSSSLLFRKVSTDSSARIYYYSGTRRSCSNGVRISPILNVPAASCVFGYLSCSCGDKSMRRGSTVTCSP
ncbi:uncharacterized protein [Elaeis guineensis]|uniref:Uncharacterized protein LOC105041235 n=1 Tax=Elaeis guineensis var. tenera TaxID=51953 RepID=A0A6I9QWD6_ELAGV|nr:uncharacterized protein LOC105041235 [Elaeis guineensis]